MAGLTFVNQVGAVEGMNQAAPGTLIPESFVRWSQDVLFDRAGLMRRRGPFNEFSAYQETSPNIRTEYDPTSNSTSDERVLSIFSTYTPNGDVRIGMLVHITPSAGNPSVVLRVFDSYFVYLGEETLPFTPNVLSIVSTKPALGGGLWVSIATDPANAETHYQFFWRGGVKGTTTTGTFEYETVDKFSTEHGSLKTTIALASKTGVSEGQFVYANLGGSNYYYVGTVKNVPITAGDNTITLDKRPFIWDPTNVDNNHIISYTTVSASSDASAVTFTVNSAVLFEIGDVITVSGVTPLVYNGQHTLTGVSGSTLTFAITGNPGNTTINGTIKMDNDLVELSKSGVTLKFISARPFEHFHGRGLLLIEDADALTIKTGTAGTSADGNWQAANVAGYNLYRASDNAYFGKVQSVSNNTTGALVADPGSKAAGEEYIMHKPKVTNLTTDFCVNNRTALSFGGLYSAVYAGYQWYGNFATDDANTNRIVFSAAHDREAVDLSRDAADSIIFPGKSKFRGLGASSAGLLVFLEDRTYILRGNDRTNFSVEQLVPEGCLCPTSIVEYGGGVFWAGKSGIMYFDGASVRNLTKDNLGLYYTDSLDEFDTEQDRVLGFMHKNNLIMHYTSWKSPFDPIRYEPLYANDWQNTPDKYGKTTYLEFDPDFVFDDFFTENNTPIYWDQKKLNNPEESSSTGKAITWGAGTQKSVTAATSNGTNATLTVGASHGLVANDVVNIVGVDTDINGQRTIASVTSTEILIATTATVTNAGGGFVSKNTGNVWNNNTSLNKWGPLRKNTSITFCYYTPTGSITTLSNMDFRGVTVAETVYGLKTIMGVNSIESDKYRARFIDIHPVFDTNTNGIDSLLIEKINIPIADLVKGPDFYLQTKHFTVGDPILRKWFQRIMLSMLLYDGAVRMDLVDDDDNDAVDINKKKHKYWEVFTEKGYDWDYLGEGESDGVNFGVVFPKLTSPKISSWENVEATVTLWDELFTADFNRYSKRISWRKSSVGFRLYQLNNYKKPFNGVVTIPNRIELQGFSVGFKPLRQGRV